MGIKGSPI